MNDTQQTVASQVARLEADCALAKGALMDAQLEIAHLQRKLSLMRQLIEEFEKDA